LQAQNIDQTRMNRDLAIMKGVLKELFKSAWKNPSQSKNNSYNAMNWNRGQKISAIYIQSYGVLFNINKTNNPAAIFANRGVRPFFINSAGNSRSKTPITKQAIINRIKEFLEDYGASIHQLKKNERLTVVFRSNSGNNSKTKLPSMAISAKMGDLEAYRRDDLNKKELANRLSITNLSKSGQSNQSLKIFAAILKNATQHENMNRFKFEDGINYFRLKNFGVLFQGTAMNGLKMLNGTNISAMNIKMSEMVTKFHHLVHLDSLRLNSPNVKPNKIQPFQDKIDSIQQKKKKKLRGALDDFIWAIKGTILDYGNTLKYLRPNDYILLSVKIADNRENLPNYIQFQVKKSVLQAYNKGSLSRKKALDKIRVAKN
jgi:hypothetical protein